jgi:hypothetical protein
MSLFFKYSASSSRGSFLGKKKKRKRNLVYRIHALLQYGAYFDQNGLC